MELSLQVLWFFGELLLLGTLVGVARLAMGSPRWGGGWWELGLIILLGCCAVAAAPRSVAEFGISPDSLEYVAGARSLVERGRFELPFGEPAVAPRYPPWFSALWIAPVLSTGGELGWTIIPVTLSAILALLCAFRIGTALGGAWGGTCSVLAVLVVPGFVFFSRQVLIDIPTTMLILSGGLVFLRIEETDRPPSSLFLLGGLIAGWAALLRPTGVVIALPLGLLLLRRARRSIPVWALFLSPIVAALVAGMRYNYLAFGDMFRSGYNLWCAIPYDFPSLTFGVRYLSVNATTMFLDSGLAMLMVFLLGGLVVLRRSGVEVRQSLSRFGFYTGVIGVPLTVFYLLYFFPSVRFLVPITTLVATLVGGMVGAVFESRGVGRFSRVMVLVFSIVIAAGYRRIGSAPAGAKGEAARTIREHTPERSLIVSGVDPVFLALIAGRDREYLPISRRVEYASKFLTERPLTIDSSDIEPRCENPDPRILSHGARQAVPRVALEDPDYVAEALANGRAVFFDATRINSEERLRFEERFTLIERAHGLFAVGLGHVRER